MNLWTLKEYADLFNVRLPNQIFVSDIGIKTIQQLREWVDKDAEKNSDIEFPEGFVIYWNGKPVAKVKNTKYMQAFSVSGGNKSHAKNVIIQSIFTGNLDDIYTMLIPELQEFANMVQEKTRKMFTEIQGVIKEIPNNHFQTQKEYALFIQKHCHQTAFQPFFYQNKEDLINGKDGHKLFEEWIKKNYQRFDEIWKERS